MTSVDPKSRHKPSQKLTLEEVLKSLQDLIRTDLLETDRAPEPSETSVPATERSASSPRQKSDSPEDEPSSATETSPESDNLNDAVRALSELIARELDTAAEPLPSRAGAPYRTDNFTPLDEPLVSAFDIPETGAAESGDLNAPMESPIAEPVGELSAATVAFADDAASGQPSATPLVHQQELFPSEVNTSTAYLETSSADEFDTVRSMDFVDENVTSADSPADEPEPALTTAQDRSSSIGQTTMDDSALAPSSLAPPMQHSLPDTEVLAPAGLTGELALSDIPVLHDIYSAPASAAGLALLSPDRARAAVIRAIAKLNVEMRQSGESGLDPKIIHRLQNFVRLELEQAIKKPAST